MLNKIKYAALGAAFVCFTLGQAHAYTLSTGAEVDAANLPAPRQSGNGAAAEKWCAEEGKRLPTLQELKEMYEKRDIIGGFTEGFDGGGWPYWAERVTNNPDGQDYGNRIIFGNGSEDYVDVGAGKSVRKFGEQGEVQYRPFWIHSGVGAYVRCVSDTPKKKISSSSNANKSTINFVDLLDMYKNNEISGVVVDCDKASSDVAKKWCAEKSSDPGVVPFEPAEISY